MGKLVLSKKLGSLNDLYSGSIFSGNEKYLLVVGTSKPEDNVPTDTPVWQEIELATGNTLINRFVSPELGLDPLYWFR